METKLRFPNFSERALRERERYDQSGLNRQTYNKVLSHAKYYYHLRRNEILLKELQYANGRRVLEIGSQCWVRWIEGFDICPEELECINISSKALEQGAERAITSRVKPRFSLMDANNLEFPDCSFDMVFGDAILHHLNFVKALEEIARVLRPNGKILFVEPLGINPVGKLVRLLTPTARTKDEQPLMKKEMAEIEKRFATRFYYEQLVSVPVGVVSRTLFSSPANSAMKIAYKVDRCIDSNFSPLRRFFRTVIIAGTNRNE